MLAYVLELSAGFPSTHTHIISGGIVMDTSPRSSRVDYSSKPKLVVDLLNRVGPSARPPCGKDCKGRNLTVLAKGNLEKLLSVCLNQKYYI